MAMAIILIMLGLLGPAAGVQWRRDRWLPSGRWVVRNLSPHAVAGVPLAGLFVTLLGLSVVWPPAVILAFLAAIGFVAVLVASVNLGSVGRLPRSLRPRPSVPRAEGRVDRPMERRRAG
jgi:hypothetical protein